MHIAGLYTYTYDAENRLTAVTGNGTNATYAYDALGRRVARTGDTSYNVCGHDGIFYYIYNLEGRWTAALNSGGGQCDYELVYAGNRHIATYAGGTVFPHADWLGTERVRINYTYVANRTYDEHCTSLPFGDALNCVGSDASPLHFTGKERDPESGLDNFIARYYTSSPGRFMSPDPFYNDSHAENPQTWNEYAYARNNPLRYVDSNGETATVSTSCTTDEQNNKTCNVNVTATIAIYSANGANLSQDQLNAAAATIQNSIDTAWSGSFTQDGVTYNVSTQVSVSVAASQGAAMQSGAQNAIGVTPGMAIPGNAISITNSRSLLASDSSPDTGIWSTTMGGGGAAQSAHEFGHLLGLVDSTNSADLMDSGVSQLMHSLTVHATQADFREGVGVVSAFQQNGFGMLPRGPNPMTVHAPDTIQTKVNVLWQLLTHKY